MIFLRIRPGPEVATEILRRVISTTGGPEHERARDDMLQLPSLVLWGKQGSQRRHSHVLSHIRKYRAGPCPAPPPMSGKQRRKAEKSIARRDMRNLQRGSVSRASRDLVAAEALQDSAQVLEKLEALHSDAPPPTVPDATAVPVQITRQQLQEVLQHLPRGSAPGPSGWTFEHIKAVAQGTPQGTAILDPPKSADFGKLRYPCEGKLATATPPTYSGSQHHFPGYNREFFGVVWSGWSCSPKEGDIIV